jgi:hypothetical protein
MNLSIQYAFCYIVIDNLSIASFDPDTPVQMRRWRRNIAHDIKFYSELSQQSLASRVCEGDVGLETSATQSDTYDLLKTYLGDGNGRDLGALGPVMCVLALVTFILTVSKEANAAVSLLPALRKIPQGRTSCLTFSDEGAMRIDQLSFARMICFIFFVALRIGIVVLLVIYGSLYLVYTTSMGDLLLNAVALEFIMNMDELIFEALAPFHVKSLVAGAECLAKLSWKKWHGLDLHCVTTIIASFSTVAVFFIFVLHPFVDILVETRDAICAGDVEFVFTTDGAGVPAWSYPKRVETEVLELADRNFPDGQDSSITAQVIKEELLEGSSYAERVVDAVLQQLGRPYHQTDEMCGYDICFYTADTGFHHTKTDAPGCCLAQKVKVPAVIAGRFSVVKKSKESLEDAVQLWNPSCFDTLNVVGGYTPMLKSSFADTVDKEDCGGSCPEATPFCLNAACIDPNCTHSAPYCTESSVRGVRARQLCPLTCGCDDPRSSLALSLPASGCGSRCTSFGGYIEKRKQIPCEDVSVNDTAWQTLMDGYDSTRLTWPLDWRESLKVWIPLFKKHGCVVLSDPGSIGFCANPGSDPSSCIPYPPFVFNINWCTEGGTYYPLKPLSYFCPIACGCHQGDPHCPDSCPQRDSSTPVCPQSQSNFNYPLNGTCAMTSQ